MAGFSAKAATIAAVPAQTVTAARTTAPDVAAKVVIGIQVINCVD
jgi:hypothetical protein